jgi:hypothetical protein
MYTDLCGIDVTQTIDVLVEPLTVNLNTPTVLTCNAPTASISSFSNFPGVAYSWTGPGISTANNASSIQLNAPGWYVLETNVNNQCFDSDSVLVISNQTPPELTLLESAGTLNCTVLTSEITAESNLSPNNFNWSGLNIAQINGSSIVVDGPGIYNCLVTNPNNGCTTSASVTINQNTQSPVLTGLTTDTLTCEIPTITLESWEDLNVLSETNYTWYTSNWNLFSTEIYPQINTSGIYNLIAYNSSNTCADTLTVNVVTDASNQFNINTIQFANVVTLETADGINDCWNIFHDQLLTEELSFLISVKKIFIFNRWGDQLLELNNQFSICEELKDLSKGTYYFIVEIETICGTEQNLKKEGFFLLK